MMLAILGGLLTGCAIEASTPAPSAGWIARNGGIVSHLQQERINLVAAKFAYAVPMTFRVKVLHNEQFSAWSWPSGDIFLTDTLIRDLTDDELAAVIGHELGHLLCAGHSQTRVALTGRHESNQAEIAADHACLGLLQHAGIPPQSMGNALRKVLFHQQLGTPLYSSLQERLSFLP